MINDYLNDKDYEDLLAFQEQIQSFDNTDFVKKTLNLIVQMFGYQSLSFFHVNDAGDFYNPIHVHFGDKAIQDYTAHYFKKDPFYFKNLNTRYTFRETVALSELVDNREFTDTEYKVDFFDKYGFENEIALYLKAGSKHIGAMGVMKFKDEGAFSERDLVLLDILTKIIAQRFSEQITHNKVILTDEENMFYSCPVGMVVLDTKYRIVNYNHAAYQCIRDINTFRTGPLSQGEIDEFLSKHKDRYGQPLKDFSVGEYDFKMVSSSINLRSASNLPVYNVLYVTPNTAYRNFAKRIEAFGLTKRELEIIKLISQGLTNQQISEKLFISPRTVRTHLDNIMTKTDSENRTAVLYNVGIISDFFD